MLQKTSTLQKIELPESLKSQFSIPNILPKEPTSPTSDDQKPIQYLNTTIDSEKIELPAPATRKRPRSYSYDDRRDSDTDDKCETMFNISIDEIINQNKRMKDQITYLIQKLDRKKCIKICILLLDKYPQLSQVSKEFLAKTSLRFQQIIYIKKKKRNHKRKAKLLVNSNRVRSGSTTIPPISRRPLTMDQKYRDFIRLQAYILTLIAAMPHSETLKIIDFLLHEFPELKAYNSKYFILISPRSFDIVNGE